MDLIQALRPTKLRVILLAVVLAIAGLVFVVVQGGLAHAAAARITASQATGWHFHGQRPTIVLEHGGWADASSWAGEIKRLQRDGFTVYAPPNPLRGLVNDSQTLADFLKTISGPIILVGHSYGGMVITNAATGNPNVKALVYIDAFLPAQGETTFGLTFAKPGTCLDPATAFNAVPYPGAPQGDFDVYLKAGPDLPYPGFAHCFANGIPAREAAVLAATQRPITFSAGSAASGVPAWLKIPSWSLIGTADHVIPPAEQIFMSTRAGAHITKINAGHLSLISHPDAVTEIIIDAARATS
jgi:pimeloyl-ACP methyl ester carboxylesterase